MATRNETLMIARQATDNAPVSRITYTDRELAQRDAMRSALEALRGPQGLSAKWRAENAQQVATRKRLAREAVAMAWIQAKARRKLESGPEIVTSVRPDVVQAPIRKVNPLADTIVIRREPVQANDDLRGKVAKPVVKRRVSAIGNFFQAVNVFLNG